MTDNEIIKGLMCHIKGTCHNCPFNTKGCLVELHDEALKMILTWKAEKETSLLDFKEGVADALSEYSNVLIGKLLFAKENTINNPNKEDNLEYIRGKAEAFETAVKLIDKALEEMVG